MLADKRFYVCDPHYVEAMYTHTAGIPCVDVVTLSALTTLMLVFGPLFARCLESTPKKGT